MEALILIAVIVLIVVGVVVIAQQRSGTNAARTLDDAKADARQAIERLGGQVFMLIGDGPARDAVRARVSAAGLGDVVDLRGRLSRPEVRATYADADVFLAPARLEAFGIAALEARTAGLVVLAHAGTGVGEFVTDGVDGFLVADDDAMTDAVVRLVQDRDLLAAMRRRAATDPPPFDWDHVLAAARAQYARAAQLV